MIDRSGQQLGNYRLIRRLGSGAFAEVYLGEHCFLKSHAAIKILHTQIQQEAIDKFLQEAQLLARLRNPNIVQVYDFSQDSSDGTHFLVMDYAPHGCLRDLHPKGSIIPLSIIVSYVRQIAAALQQAHDEKIVHRDIKPENLLLGRNKEVILSDFGIAAVAQSTASRKTQGIAGTPYYMAPEQFRGKPQPTSDQYALAVVIYEWLCGTPPFTEGDFIQLGYQHAFEPVPPLREKVPTVAPEVEQVVMKALAKDPEQRFGSVQAFAIALEEAYKKQEAKRQPSGRPISGTLTREEAYKKQGAKSQMKEIAEKLAQLNLSSLYELLGRAPTHSREDLVTLAEQLYLDTVRRQPKTVEVTLKQELASHAKKLFASDEMRKKYDESLRLAPIDALLEALDDTLNRATHKEVYAQQVLDFLESAQRVGWSREEALSKLKEHARMRKWFMEVPGLDVTPQQRCGYCRQMNDTRRNFCHTCNRELNMTCPQCGKTVPADAVGCGNCGFRVGDRYWVDDSLEKAHHLLASRELQEAQALLSELERPGTLASQRNERRRSVSTKAISSGSCRSSND